MVFGLESGEGWEVEGVPGVGSRRGVGWGIDWDLSPRAIRSAVSFAGLDRNLATLNDLLAGETSPECGTDIE